MRKGYRPNVGIIIANTKGKLLYCKRRRSNNWQFPQGGIDRNETPEQAAFRELFEEVGIKKHNVKIIAESQHWYQYDLPKKFQLNKLLWNNFRGQSQKWFIFKLIADAEISFDNDPHPEFDSFKWVNFWDPIDEIIEFKKDIYQKVLTEFEQPYKKEFEI